MFQVQEKVNPPSENSLLGEISLLSYDSVLDKSVGFSSNLSSILEYCFNSNQIKITKESLHTNHDFNINTETQSTCSYSCNNLSPMDLSMHGEELRPELLLKCDEEIRRELLSKRAASIDKTDLNLNGADFPIDVDEHLKKYAILDRMNTNLNVNSAFVSAAGELHKYEMSHEHKTNLDANLHARDHANILNENKNQNVNDLHSDNAGEQLQKCDIRKKTTVTVNGVDFQGEDNENLPNFDTNNINVEDDGDPLLEIEHETEPKTNGYLCELCNSKFTRFADLLKHDDSAHEAFCKRYSCPICKRVFISASRMRMHRSKHREKTHKCTTCDKLFASSKSLRVHNRRHLGTYKCNICGFVTTSKVYLREHLLKHKGQAIKYLCRVCEKMFASRSSLMRHANIHSRHRGKLFKCPKCETSCRTPGELADHMNIHSKVQTEYACRICSKLYSSKKSLHAHMTRHEEAKFVCKTCDKRVFTKTELRDHEGTHSDSKPFQCFHCDKQFSFRNTLIRHVQKHYPRIRSDIAVE